MRLFELSCTSPGKPVVFHRGTVEDLCDTLIAVLHSQGRRVDTELHNIVDNNRANVTPAIVERMASYVYGVELGQITIRAL